MNRDLSSKVNVFLDKIRTKKYVKKIACYPGTSSTAFEQIIVNRDHHKSDFRDLGYELTPDEKVHVALLAVESSKQSALLYGLHAVMKHMYNT